jgi:hypothetical protein
MTSSTGGTKNIKRYLRLWLQTYVKPVRFAETVEQTPAPWWGFIASLQRALMDSLFLYLPLALLGRIPPEPSYLPFIADGNYYLVLVGLTPLVLTAGWLLSCAVIHLILTACKYKSDFNSILNITGFTALMIGTVLILWDWVWVAIGGITQYGLGISHLVIDLWGITVAAIAFKIMLKVQLWLGMLVNLTAVIVALPMAIMFMRSPL